MNTKPIIYAPHVDNILWIDTETWCELDIKTVGTGKYTDEASMMLCGFSLNGNYAAYDFHLDEYPIPQFAADHINNGGLVGAHNAIFDYLILKQHFPHLRIEQMIDTQAIVAAHGLPLSLEKAGAALGLPSDLRKLKDGKRLVGKFCTPRKPTKHDKSTRVMPWDAPDDWVKFRDEYLYLDVMSMIEVFKSLEPLSEYEQGVWVDTQRINLRGIPVDVPTAQHISDKLDVLIDEESSKFIRLTGLFPTQRDKVLKWVNKQGVPAANLQAATVLEIIEDKATPSIVREALEYRANTTHMSFKKYPVILAAARFGEIVCGTLMYHVGHTGRFGGRLLQPQNLTRGSINNVEAAQRIVDGEFSVELVKSAVRAMIYHEDGLTISDYSSIEARVVQWLCGDEEALEVFRSGKDPYIWMATKIYNVAYEDVSKAQRFCGKQAVLGLAYQMNYQKFIEMIEGYGETMPVDEAKLAVKVYRQTHAKLVRFWNSIQDCAVMAIERPGKKIVVNKRLSFMLEGEFLVMTLPSGRRFKYYDPRIELSFGKATFSYMHTNEKGQYVRTKTYGGKITENAVQAIARDVLCEAVHNMLDKGYDIVTHIHDEVVLCGTYDLPKLSVDMCTLSAWADGLPLQADGFHSPRYIKD